MGPMWGPYVLIWYALLFELPIWVPTWFPSGAYGPQPAQMKPIWVPSVLLHGICVDLVCITIRIAQNNTYGVPCGAHMCWSGMHYYSNCPKQHMWVPCGAHMCWSGMHYYSNCPEQHIWDPCGGPYVLIWYALLFKLPRTTHMGPMWGPYVLIWYALLF